MPLPQFILYTALGSGAFNAGLIVLGHQLGQRWTSIGEYSDPVNYTIYGLIAVAIGWALSSCPPTPTRPERPGLSQNPYTVTVAARSARSIERPGAEALGYRPGFGDQRSGGRCVPAAEQMLSVVQQTLGEVVRRAELTQSRMAASKAAWAAGSPCRASSRASTR